MDHNTVEYQAIVWTTDSKKSGQRVTVHARKPIEAKILLTERFGKDSTFSIWNEEDANKTR